MFDPPLACKANGSAPKSLSMSCRIALSLIVSISVLSLGCHRGHVDAPGMHRPDPLPHAININTASAEELQKIPYIGGTLAAKIVEHRNVHGPFRRVEHLMLVQGIGDKRFRKIRPLLRVE